MSVVTSVVVIMPSEKADLAEELGQIMMRVQLGTDEVPEHEGYRPVPWKVGSQYVCSGSNVPGGVVFWLGIDHARMDDIVAELRRDGGFEDVLIWYEPEDGPIQWCLL